MPSGFKSLLSCVERRHAELVGADLVPVYRDRTRKHIPPEPGVYVLYEDKKPLYTGRTKNLRQRLGEHSLCGSRPNQAPLAQALARECVDAPVSASELHLREEFKSAKKRVHAMSVLWVKEADADCRYLLEFYAAKELQTPYNDFKET